MIASYQLTGVRPLLMCNVRLADPTDPFTRKLREINDSKARNKEMPPELMEAKLNTQWEGGLYWTEKDGVIMPSYNLEACLIEGAKKYKAGPVAKLVRMTEDSVPVKSPSGFPDTRDLEAYRKHPQGHLTRTCVLQKKSTILVRRPMIPTGWSLKVSFEFDPEFCSKEDLTRWINRAGQLCGIGTWRPKFGRFIVEEIS